MVCCCLERIGFAIEGITGNQESEGIGENSYTETEALGRNMMSDVHHEWHARATHDIRSTRLIISHDRLSVCRRFPSYGILVQTGLSCTSHIYDDCRR